MLAKDLKIQNLKRQKVFITQELMKRTSNPSQDGNTDYCYVGTLFPETIQYLESEGFTVQKCEGEVVSTIQTGFPAYLISVSEDLKLDEGELRLAEEVDVAVFCDDES